MQLLMPDFRMLHDYIRSARRIACETLYTLLARTIGGARVILWHVIKNLIKGLWRFCHDAVQPGIAINKDHVSRAGSPGPD